MPSWINKKSTRRYVIAKHQRLRLKKQPEKRQQPIKNNNQTKN